MTPSRTKAKVPVPLKFGGPGTWYVAPTRTRPIRACSWSGYIPITSGDHPHFRTRSDAVKWQKAQRKKEGT